MKVEGNFQSQVQVMICLNGYLARRILCQSSKPMLFLYSPSDQK